MRSSAEAVTRGLISRAPGERDVAMGSHRRETVGAVLLCIAWLIAALYGSRELQPLPPDAAHTAVVARNLVRGLGNTIDWVPYHFGLHPEIRQVPEWHGILRAPILAGLFGLLGIRAELVRVPGLAAVAATGLVAFLLARTLFGSLAGWLACLMTLSSAALLFWGWVGTDDTGFACLFLVTLHLCYLGLERDERFLRWAGLAGALALLEKQTGLMLPALYLVVLWRRRVAGRHVRNAALALLVPFAVAVGLYLARNYAAHGELSFRLGPLNWLYKAHGANALWRLYDPPPTLGDVLRDLGPARVLAIVGTQLAGFARAVYEIPLQIATVLPRPEKGTLHLLAIGMPSLLLHVRRRQSFFWLGAVSVAASVAFICVLYSVERRYFLHLVPLSAISIAGALCAGLEGVGREPLRALQRGLAAVITLGIVVYALAFTARLVRKPPAWAQDHRANCPGAMSWLRANTPPEAVVLTSYPAPTSWLTERRTVLLPSGPTRHFVRVVHHYGAAWVLIEDTTAQRRRSLTRALRNSAVELRSTRVFAGGGCAVYALRGHGASRAARHRMP